MYNVSLPWSTAVGKVRMSGMSRYICICISVYIYISCV